MKQPANTNVIEAVKKLYSAYRNEDLVAVAKKYATVPQ
jgi:hypothetical protein